MDQRRAHTTKDVATLLQLNKNKQLIFGTEFQRNSVWPRAAKAYLIDTIVHNRPIPFLYFRRSSSAQTGLPVYEVIDGQQRLRAVLEFVDNGFALSESTTRSLKGKRFKDLTAEQRQQFLTYDFYIEELVGYSDIDITDMFVRMNKYVVKLSPQEIRHADYTGAFRDFVEMMGRKPFWKEKKVFTAHQVARMRPVEFSAELTILLLEGPQDKKAAINLYYEKYGRKFPAASDVKRRLEQYFSWMGATVPAFEKTRYRKPTDLYSLVGALESITKNGKHLRGFANQRVGTALAEFDEATRSSNPTQLVAKYLAAASRQTDNITPRLTRIEILSDVVRRA